MGVKKVSECLVSFSLHSAPEASSNEGGGPVAEVWKPQLETLGRYIRTQRQLADLSLRQMAELAEVSNPYLSQIERGMHQPSVRVLKSIAKALNISAESLLTQAGLLDESETEGGSTESGVEAFTGNAAPKVPWLFLMMPKPLEPRVE